MDRFSLSEALTKFRHRDVHYHDLIGTGEKSIRDSLPDLDPGYSPYPVEALQMLDIEGGHYIDADSDLPRFGGQYWCQRRTKTTSLGVLQV